MPDRRTSRGPSPRDKADFAPDQLTKLRRVADETQWLVDRGYRGERAIDFVGDHHQLTRRQRAAVMRGCCSSVIATERRAKSASVRDQAVVVDGFNQLITVEAGLSGAPLFVGADGWLRDIQGVHGTYRTIGATPRALEELKRVLMPAASVLWLFDRPVSNSGKLAGLVREMGFDAEVRDRVDADVATFDGLAATSDGPVIDRAHAAVDLAALALADVQKWVVPLGTEA